MFKSADGHRYGIYRHLGAFKFAKEEASGECITCKEGCLHALFACAVLDCAPARGATPSEVLAFRIMLPESSSAQRTRFCEEERLSRVSLVH